MVNTSIADELNIPGIKYGIVPVNPNPKYVKTMRIDIDSKVSCLFLKVLARIKPAESEATAAKERNRVELVSAQMIEARMGIRRITPFAWRRSPRFPRAEEKFPLNYLLHVIN
ncbi:MAG: hypothetical protein O6846_04025 [Thaumarchaeota archaeon]|nr:hypothetical protein [Nitrososphaerota archaeon]